MKSNFDTHKIVRGILFSGALILAVSAISTTQANADAKSPLSTSPLSVLSKSGIVDALADSQVTKTFNFVDSKTGAKVGYATFSATQGSTQTVDLTGSVPANYSLSSGESASRSVTFDSDSTTTVQVDASANAFTTKTINFVDASGKTVGSASTKGTTGSTQSVDLTNYLPSGYSVTGGSNTVNVDYGNSDAMTVTVSSNDSSSSSSSSNSSSDTPSGSSSSDSNDSSDSSSEPVAQVTKTFNFVDAATGEKVGYVSFEGDKGSTQNVDLTDSIPAHFTLASGESASQDVTFDADSDVTIKVDAGADAYTTKTINFVDASGKTVGTATTKGTTDSIQAIDLTSYLPKGYKFTDSDDSQMVVDYSTADAITVNVSADSDSNSDSNSNSDSDSNSDSNSNSDSDSNSDSNSNSDSDSNSSSDTDTDVTKTFNFVDATSGTKVGYASFTGAKGSTQSVDLSKSLPSGYTLASGENATRDLTFDEDDDVTVKVNADQSAYTTKKINFVDASGNTVGTASTKGTAGSTQNVDLSDYLPSGYQVVGGNNSLAVDYSNSDDITVTVEKTNSDDTTITKQVKYVDDSGNVISSVDVNGSKGSSTSYSATSNLPDGYTLADGQSGNITLDFSSNDSVAIKVVKTAATQITKQVNYVDDSGNIISSVPITADKNSSQDYTAGTHLPKGYTLASGQAANLTLDFSNDDPVSISIVPSAKSVVVPVQYINQKTGEVIKIDHVTGVSGTSTTYSTDGNLPLGYVLADNVASSFAVNFTDDATPISVYVTPKSSSANGSQVDPTWSNGAANGNDVYSPDANASKPKDTIGDQKFGSASIQKSMAILATQKVTMYKTASGHGVVKTFAKKSSDKAPMFVVDKLTINHGHTMYHVQDVTPTFFGHKRSHGKSGWVKADGMIPAYYSSKNVKTLKVINSAGIAAYKHIDLSGRVRYFKKGTTLKVKSFEHHNLTTRYKLSDGSWITANKKFVRNVTK